MSFDDIWSKRSIQSYKPYNEVGHLNENTFQRTSSIYIENFDTVSSYDYNDTDYLFLSKLLIML